MCKINQRCESPECSFKANPLPTTPLGGLFHSHVKSNLYTWSCLPKCCLTIYFTLLFKSTTVPPLQHLSLGEHLSLFQHFDDSDRCLTQHITKGGRRDHSAEMLTLVPTCLFIPSPDFTMHLLMSLCLSPPFFLFSICYIDCIIEGQCEPIGFSSRKWGLLAPTSW